MDSPAARVASHIYVLLMVLLFPKNLLPRNCLLEHQMKPSLSSVSFPESSDGQTFVSVLEADCFVYTKLSWGGRWGEIRVLTSHHTGLAERAEDETEESRECDDECNLHYEQQERMVDGVVACHYPAWCHRHRLRCHLLSHTHKNTSSLDVREVYHFSLTFSSPSLSCSDFQSTPAGSSPRSYRSFWGLLAPLSLLVKSLFQYLILERMNENVNKSCTTGPFLSQLNTIAPGNQRSWIGNWWQVPE